MSFRDTTKRTAAPLSTAVAVASLLALFMLGTGGGTPAFADIPGLETKSASGTANANSVKTLGVSCSSGKKALGGGVEVPTSGVVQILATVPSGATGDGSDNGSGWLGEYRNSDSNSQTVVVWVVCATIGA